MYDVAQQNIERNKIQNIASALVIIAKGVITYFDQSGFEHF